nr:unnamed protein product [Callosobruchus chinensis]
MEYLDPSLLAKFSLSTLSDLSSLQWIATPFFIHLVEFIQTFKFAGFTDEVISCKIFLLSAISISLILSGSVGSDPPVCRFLKGVSKLRPAQPKYTFTWDPHQVLTYLESLDETIESSLKTLSYKLVTLIALVTGQRLQTLYSIKVSDIVESSSGLQTFITDYLKTSGTGRQQPCLHLPFFKENTKICAASTLKRYLTYTNRLREFETEYLFITFSKPHKRASKQTISRWVKNTLQSAGIDRSIFTPHSTRHASSSLALRRGVSLDVISGTAGWTEKSKCFAQFYNRSLSGTDMFATAILSDDRV